jgi:hypothetical protein
MKKEPVKVYLDYAGRRREWRRSTGDLLAERDLRVSTGYSFNRARRMEVALEIIADVSPKGDFAGDLARSVLGDSS